ncbi:flagellin N-terminal helical domain-containing protein [Methylobacterium sp. SyP6R]|uniref:flagellin N-terminal helical domain-containing protein n=1 Tax=Methylobacterium sp. SyP6R TaxID=2718876 RepID=UPI001F46A672|nr:flagellin [Methylobacterium sp. SyP6R]MCF4129172.1 flagellin [Methylobacterium sp. SyP6R]
MTSLLTNNAAMTALTTLKNINQNLDTTSNRVSTGQRVSAASDNAAYWSIATTVRTDNASLGAVKDSLGLGSSSVDTAYNGLNSIISDLQNMRAKLQTAMTPGVDRSKVQTEIAAIQSKMKATADSSNSSGQNWLSVNSSASNSAYLATQNVVGGFSRTASGTITFSQIAVNVQSIKLYDVNSTSVNTAATNAQIVGSTSLTGTAGFGSGTGTADFSGPNEVSLTVTVGGVAGTLTLNAGNMQSAAQNLSKVTTSEFLNALNNQIAANGSLAGKVTAGLDSSGRLNFTTTGTGAASTLNVQLANPSAGGKRVLDIGLGTVTTGAQSAVATGTAITTLDLSTGSKVITINDGATPKTLTLVAADFTALGASATSASNTAVNGADLVAIMNTKLAAATASTVTASFSNGKITLSNSDNTKTIATGGADVAAFGFTATTFNNVAAGTVVVRSASGTNAGTTQAQGILDTAAGTYNPQFGGGSYSIANLDISKLVGTNGDADLQAIISAVDKAIGKVTDAGTKLGANKTQIDGQKTFVDTLMKANDRTIGILVDADVEEESTKLKALQTQQQLAVQALSIANSASQNVLSLFR